MGEFMEYPMVEANLYMRFPGESTGWTLLDLSANKWYARQGFVKECGEITSSGRRLTHWRLPIARP